MCFSESLHNYNSCFYIMNFYILWLSIFSQLLEIITDVIRRRRIRLFEKLKDKYIGELMLGELILS